jgi:cation diffusion facilitator family transporter
MVLLECIVCHHHSRESQVVAPVGQIENHLRLPGHRRLHGRQVDPFCEFPCIERPQRLTVDLQTVASGRQAGNLQYLLGASGILICYESYRRLRAATELPHLYAIWPLIASVAVKSGSSLAKFAYGRRLGSTALVADAWHDGVEIVSGLVALSALTLTLYDPAHFAAADHWGGFAVGLIVLLTAFHVVRDTSDELMDAMPNDKRIERIREIALSSQGVLAVEKTYARNIGLQYHVELHIEVDPQMTVQASHDLATSTRFLIRNELDWVADVEVHVEPFIPQASRLEA